MKLPAIIRKHKKHLREIAFAHYDDTKECIMFRLEDEIKDPGGEEAWIEHWTRVKKPVSDEDKWIN